MYKLLNYIFGWDYIIWENCLYKGVARIRTLPNGDHYFLVYGAISNYVPLTENQENDAWVIAWLTCDKNKYLKQK